MQDVELPGPIDVVVIEFPDGAATERAAEELEAVLELGIVGLFDLVAVTTEADGRAVEIDLTATGSTLGAFAPVRRGPQRAVRRNGRAGGCGHPRAGHECSPGRLREHLGPPLRHRRARCRRAARGRGAASRAQVLVDALEAAESTQLTNERTPRCQDSCTRGRPDRRDRRHRLGGERAACSAVRPSGSPDRDAHIYAERQAAYQQQAGYAPAPNPAPAPHRRLPVAPRTTRSQQLQQLGELRAQGMASPRTSSRQQKAKILAS